MHKIYYLTAAVFFLFSGCKKNTPDTPPCPEIVSIDFLTGGTNNVITITGNSFGRNTTAASVKFNGAAATILSIDDNSIIVRVPANVSTGKISVSLNGCTANSTGDFVVLPGKWTQKASFSNDINGRVLGIGFSINNKGYHLGGNDGGTSNKDLTEYDVNTDTWTQRADCPIDLQDGLSMVINGKAYITLGESYRTNTINKQLWEYNPVTNTWLRKADFPGTFAANRIAGVGNANKGYVFINSTGANNISINEFWEYDQPADSWSKKTNLPATKYFIWPIAFAVNNKIYFGVGSLAGSGSKDLWEYDIATNSWITKTTFPGLLPRGIPKAFVIGDKGYIAGGGRECWEYDGVLNSWKQVSFIGYYYGGICFTIGNKGYYASGANLDNKNYKTNELWEFDPAK
jgi:IPT/TIG domain